MMMKNMKRRSLETRFWKDSYIQSLTSNGKLLFNYLLMNEYVNIIHIYELPENYISLETGITIKQIQDLKLKFQQDKKFLFKDNWIKIVNADKYENYFGDKNNTAKENLLKNISSHILEYFNTPIDTPIDTQSIGTSNQYPITNNQKPINIYSKLENIDDELMQKIADHYHIKLSDVKSTYDLMYLWSKSKGKVYKDYKAGLMGWVQKRIEEKKILIIK